MAFRSAPVAVTTLAPEVLTAQLVGIGMAFAAASDPQADIEPTVVRASIVGMIEDDLRVLSVLTTWLGVHHAHLNADRLVRIVGAQPSERVRAYWAGVARWLAKDRRLARLAALHQGPPVELLSIGNAFQIQRRGEDPRFIGSPLRAPRGTLRDRPDDVLTPEVLVRRHAGYRNRVLMGPSFRADVWTALERHPDLSVADAARNVGCSFATAWQVVRDFHLLRGPVRPDLDPSAAAVVRADRDRRSA